MKSGEAFESSRENIKKKSEGGVSDDQRRNLYILGIPHHMSLEELKKLFGQFGQVQHAVILAVLDAFRRRRGFVVMNSNSEAAAAMKGMSGAIVQYVLFDPVASLRGALNVLHAGIINFTSAGQSFSDLTVRVVSHLSNCDEKPDCAPLNP